MTGWADAGFWIFGERILWTDLTGNMLSLASGLHVSGVVYGIFFVLVLIGFRDWLRQHHARPRPASTQTEAVPA